MPNSQKQHRDLTNRPWCLHETMEWQVDLMKMWTSGGSSVSNKICSCDGRIPQLAGWVGLLPVVLSRLGSYFPGQVSSTSANNFSGERRARNRSGRKCQRT